MYDKYADKDKPVEYLWRCTTCHVLRANHDYDSDHGSRWEQTWYYRGYVTKWPHYTTFKHGLYGYCGYRHAPPNDVVRAEHKKDRQHVRMALHELTGTIDWDEVDDFVEPTNVTGPHSAWWNWW